MPLFTHDVKTHHRGAERERELKPQFSVGADLPNIQFLAHADEPETHRRRARKVLKPRLNVGFLGHWKSNSQDCALHRFPSKYPWLGRYRFALPSACCLTTVTCVCEGAAEATVALALCLWRALRLWNVLYVCASNELSPLQLIAWCQVAYSQRRHKRHVTARAAGIMSCD